MMTYKETGHLAEKQQNVKEAKGHHSHLKKGLTQCQSVRMEVTQAKHFCLCLVSNDLHGMATGFTMLASAECLSEVKDYGALKGSIVQK